MDPTIEKLHFDENDSKTLIHLKFRGKEEILLNSPVELNSYLSSGTVKGMITFTLAREVLQSGGYIVVDEVENHFNKEIVTTLLRFFMDNKLNKMVEYSFFLHIIRNCWMNMNVMMVYLLPEIVMELLRRICQRY